jgi:hypothetical protein
VNQQLANVKIARFIRLNAVGVEIAKLRSFLHVIGRCKMTNREWLAGMTDRELGKWLDEHIDACCVCSHKKGNSCDIPGNGYDCENGRYEWLGMEHKKQVR